MREALDAGSPGRAQDGGQGGSGGPSPGRRLLASFVYGALGLAFTTLLLGLTTSPRDSVRNDQPGYDVQAAATRTASAVEPEAGAEDPTGGFRFLILLDPETPGWSRHAWVSDLESRLKARLARRGFPNIGVSVSHDGGVFLAGTLFDRSEEWTIKRIVQRTPGVASVHFPHPEIRKLYGPGYLGLETGLSRSRTGVRVMKVWAGSPAAMAGIRPGDVILSFAGRRVRGPETFRYLVASHVGGQRLPMLIERGSAERHVTVRLGETPAVVLD